MNKYITKIDFISNGIKFHRHIIHNVYVFNLYVHKPNMTTYLANKLGNKISNHQINRALSFNSFTLQIQ